MQGSDGMILTPENYFSPDADRAYMSVSQYKSFLKCEAAAVAQLAGQYDPIDREALLVGKYVHAWSDETLTEFVDRHPEILSGRGATKGELKTPFRVANAMIETLAADPKVMAILRGEKEVPITGEIGGVAWKGRIDVRNRKFGYIADLKTAQSISEFRYDPRFGKRVSFVEQWDYMIQAAVYTELERQTNGATPDFYLIAVTKQDPPDHALIDLTDPDRLDQELSRIQMNLPHIIAVKSGIEPPARCENCAYCRATKRVERPVHYTELREAI